MLDFNDTSKPAETRRTFDDSEREALRAGLIAGLPSVLATLFLAGKKRRGKFLIGDVLGSPGDSLEVVLDGEKLGCGRIAPQATAATFSISLPDIGR